MGHGLARLALAVCQFSFYGPAIAHIDAPNSQHRANPNSYAFLGGGFLPAPTFFMVGPRMKVLPTETRHVVAAKFIRRGVLAGLKPEVATPNWMLATPSADLKGALATQTTPADALAAIPTTPVPTNLQDISWTQFQSLPLSLGPNGILLANGTSGCVIGATAPRHGHLEMHSDGSCIYAPDPQFNGEDDFCYTLRADSGQVSTGVVRINLLPILSTIICNPDIVGGQTSEGRATLTGPAAYGGQAVTLESSAPELLSVPTALFIAEPRNVATFPIVSKPTSADTRVTLTAKTPQGAVSCSVWVRARKKYPMLDVYLEVNEGGQMILAAPGLLERSKAEQGATLFLTEGPKYGMVRLGRDGALLYRPLPGFVGADAFRVGIRTGPGDVTGGIVHVQVCPVLDSVTVSHRELGRVAITVGLSAPCPNGSARISLWSDSKLSVLPAGIIVPQGQKEAVLVLLWTGGQHARIFAELNGIVRRTEFP